MKNNKYVLLLLLLLMYGVSVKAQIGECKGKYFGNITAYSVPSNYTDLWNQTTSENGSKWGTCDRGNGQYDFSNSDLAYNTAQNSGGAFKFHALIWGAQAPGYLENASAAEIETAIRNWYQAVEDHYDPMGGLDMIDVLNEPVNTPINREIPNLKAALTRGYQSEPANAGDLNNPYGWAIWCFQLAREHFPDAELLINEYNVEHNWNNCREEYIQMSNAIKNAPNLSNGEHNLIDGIGLQAHGIETLSANAWRNCIDEVWDRTGIPIHISEFDIAADPNEAHQRTKYEEFIPIAWEHPHVAGITLWGYVQGQTWRPGNEQMGPGGTDTGIQYEDLTDRPAMTWLKSYMNSRPDLSCCPDPGSFADCSNAGNPEISLTAPENNEAFTTSETINITATASDPNGSISNVEFFNGTNLLGSDNTSPFSYAWDNVSAGTYTIRAVATDNEGNTAEDEITITVNVPQGPYNDTPHTIPGTVQAQEYDVGGHDFAYFDTDPGENLGEAFRPDEGVDIGGPEDEGDHESYFLGWMEDGEWVEYTVNVEQAGTYQITYRVASGGNGSFDLSFDGTVVDQVQPPSTADDPDAWWEGYTYTDVVTEDIELEAGEQIMRLDISTGGFNLNYINLEYQPAAPEVSSITEDLSVIDGGEATLEVTATGSTPLTYQWYVDGNPINGADQSTYTIPSVTPGDEGDYTVEITNDLGTVTSDPVSLTVITQEPYLGDPMAIPGTIQAQDFDLGGQGLAYSDATEENEGGGYRPDEWVGLEENPVEDGDYHIGWTEAGEWVEYTVNVEQAGDYDITYRVASGGSGELALLFDDTQVDQITVPSTSTADDWWTDYTYTDVVTETVTLDAGEQVMRVELIEGGFNLNYITFAPSVVTSTAHEAHASIQCYPNPSNDAFHLEVEGAFQYTVTDINGDQLAAANANGTATVGDKLPAGVYIIHLMTQGTTQTFRVVKH